MQELIRSLQFAQLESTSPSEVSRLLFKYQSELNAQFFINYSVEDKEVAFKEIWKFLLFAASHSSSSVRLSAYRLTGSFLLKMLPYCSQQVRKTFSDVSMVATIDIKSSAIIASSFAFISNRISLNYLDNFLDSTPVFHHFTISDPIFSEHLSSIITNLGELGFDWFSTLLHSFLALIQTSSDRYLIKSVSAIISHDPINLFNDVLQFINEQKNYRQHLSLVSFIISSSDILKSENFDLYNLAKASIEILNDPKTANATEIDSALQILSIKSSSFNISILANNKDDTEDDTVKMTLISENHDQITIDFDIKSFSSRPTMYSFDLPIKFSKPLPDDSLLTVAAKMKSLAKHVNANPGQANLVLDIFLQYYSKEFNENVSAVLQGIADSIVALISNADHKVLIPLLENCIFTPSANWFHSSDILTLIKNMPPSSFNALFGPKGLKRVVALLLKLVLSKNEQVSKCASKALKVLVTLDNFRELTLLISSRIDIYDEFNLVHFLPLLTSILDHFKGKFELDHLNFIVFQLLELVDLYSSDLAVLTEIFFFLGCFELNFIMAKTIHRTFYAAVAIIAASITSISGFSAWQNEIPADQLRNAQEMIDADIRSRNIDVSSENSLNYLDYLRPCVSAMKFLYGIPAKIMNKTFVVLFYEKLRNIFPLRSAKFIEKYWAMLSDDEKVNAVIQMAQSLSSIQNYEVDAMVCKLYIRVHRNEYQTKLLNSRDELRSIAEFLEKNPRNSTEEQRVIFKAITYFTNTVRGDPTPEFECEIKKYCPDLYTNLFNQLCVNNSPQPSQMPQPEKSLEYVYLPIPNLADKLDITHPCIKTQLINSTFTFSGDDYQQILNHFIETADIIGINIIFRICYSKGVNLEIPMKSSQFPDKALPIAIQYLKNIDSPNLEAFLEPLQKEEENLSLLTKRAIIFATSKKYIEGIINSEKLTKYQLKSFAQVIPLIDFPNSTLIEAVKHCYSLAKTASKLHYTVIITLNLLMRMANVDNDLIETLLDLFNEKYQNLPTYSIASCLFVLSQKVQTYDKLVVFITKLIASVSPISPEISLLYSTLLRMTKGNAVYCQNLPKIIEHLLQLHQPSLFVGAADLFAKVITQLNDQNMKYLLKNCFPELLQFMPKLLCIYPIADRSASSFSKVFQLPALKKQQQMILNNHSLLFPNGVRAPDNASFLPLTDIMAHLIFYTEASPKMASELGGLLATIQNMVTVPGSEFLLQSFIKIVAFRADRTAQIVKRQTIVMDQIDALLKTGLRDSDFYRSYYIICDWCSLLFKVNGFQQTLPVVSGLIFKSAHRLFPVVAGVAMFLRRLRNSNIQNLSEMVEKLNTSLIKTGKTMMEKCKAHGVAVALLADPPLVHYALELALFEDDCQKSDAIVENVMKSNPNLL